MKRKEKTRIKVSFQFIERINKTLLPTEFSSKGEKSFNNNEKQRLYITNKNLWKFVPSRTTLQEMLKEILLGKGK